MAKKVFESLINGEIQLILDKSKSALLVNGLVESGWEVENLWDQAFKKLIPAGHTMNKILILGFAGGSIVKLIKKRWPKCRLTAVEIDPVMTMIAKEFFPQNVIDVDLKIGDAVEFVHNLPAQKTFDLVIVDCYLHGDEQPENTKTIDFLLKLKQVSSKVFINQLISPTGTDRLKNAEFLRELYKHFPIETLKVAYNVVLAY